MTELPFLRYAAQNWRNHILNNEVLNGLASAIDVLLRNANLCSAAFQVSNFQSQLKDLAVRSATFDTIPTGHIALHFAAYWNLGDKTCQLIDEGQPLNARDSQNWTPLHWACFSGSQQTVQILFLRGADTGAKDSVGWSPLFWAALQGDIISVELLLQHESDHMVRDVHGWTVLRWAAARRQTKVIEMLVNHYRQIQSQDCRPDSSTPNDAEPPKTITDGGDNDTDVIRRDLIQGLRDDTTRRQDQPGVDFVDLYHVFFDKKPDMEQFWRSNYFDPPVGNAWRTMFKASRMRQPSDGIRKAANMFEKRDFSGGQGKAWSSGLIHAAIRGKDLVAVKLLLELGVDINGDELRTPLHTAMFHTDSAIANLLLEHGADIEAHDHEHLTPLQQAVIHGFVEPAKLLLSMGADVNAAHTFGEPDHPRRMNGLDDPAVRTPLMLACGLGGSKGACLEMLKMLLNHGASVHVNDKDKGSAGMSVLHYAASSRCPELLEAVINAGADIMATDNYGRTSFHHLVLGYRRNEGIYEPRCEDAYETPALSPDPAASCLNILLSRGGYEHMNKTARWEHKFHHSLKHEECSGLGSKYWPFFNQERTYSPLALAVIENDRELFDELRRIGAKFKTSVPLGVCLSKAIEMMSADAIEPLLANGATFPQRCINEFGNLDNILLDHCAQSDNLEDLEEVLKVLIPHGLEMNHEFPRSEGSEDRRTLLGWAMSNSSVGAVEVLTKLGADPFYEHVEHLDCFLIAFIEQKFDNLRFLLGFSVTNPRANHWTQRLDHSKLAGDSEMLEEVCQALKEKGTLMDVGESLLLKASESGYSLAVGALLRMGVDANAVGRDGCTALHLSFQNTPSWPVVEQLLAHSADPNVSDTWGWQPLHLAARKGYEKAARMLLDAGASPRATTREFSGHHLVSGLHVGDSWIVTPLHLAALEGNLNMVEILLSASSSNHSIANEEHLWNMRTCAVPSIGNHSYESQKGHIGLTALEIALDKGYLFGYHGWRHTQLQIAQMLVGVGASVDGVANRLVPGDKDIFLDEGFETLWDFFHSSQKQT
jgi:ankyrin repeat protein